MIDLSDLAFCLYLRILYFCPGLVHLANLTQSVFSNLKKNLPKMNRFVLAILAMFQQQQHLHLVDSSSPVLTSGFQLKSLNSNWVCMNNEGFKEDSRVSCANQCLIRENYGDCTAFTFDPDQENSCVCGSAMCSLVPPFIADAPDMMVMLNSNCDTTIAGNKIQSLKSSNFDLGWETVQVLPDCCCEPLKIGYRFN